MSTSKKISIIVLVLFVATFGYCSTMIRGHQDAVRIADRFVIESAVGVRKYILESGACPEQLKGWKQETKYGGGYQQEIWQGNESLSVPIFYKCGDDLSFDYIVKYGIDAGIYVSGKSDQDIKLTYGHFTELKEIYIRDTYDVESIIEKIHE